MNATTSDGDDDSDADERTATTTHIPICEPLSIRYRRIQC